jgi:hypothetical protein
MTSEARVSRRQLGVLRDEGIQAAKVLVSIEVDDVDRVH